MTSAATAPPPDAGSRAVVRGRPTVRGDIQGLRAVAVLLVIGNHAQVPGFGGGFVGVDVFFVVSGFLITGILLRQAERHGRVSISDFYARRARRILPAAAVVLLASTLASWALLSYVRVHEVLGDVVWASLFAANIRFATGDTDYFADDGFTSPIRHFWSLAVEEQFYLLWPLLVGAAFWWAHRRRRGPRRTLTLVLSGLCAASLCWCVVATGLNETSAYFSTLTRAWELGAGALLAIAASRVAELRRTLQNLLSLAGLVMIAVATLALDDATAFPGVAALLPVTGTVLVLAGGLHDQPRGASVLLDRAPMRWVGDISYSLYLWHLPLLVLPEALFHDALPARWTALLVGVAFVVSALTYRWVETPFREHPFWHAPRLRPLSLWPAAAACVLATVALVGLQLPTDDPAAARMDPDQKGAVTGKQDVLEAIRNAAHRAQKSAPLPDRLRPSPLKLKDADWHVSVPKRCWASTKDTRHQVCSFGDRDADRTLALRGDSHAGIWLQPLEKVAKERGWRVVLFLKTGCPAYDAPMWRPPSERRYTECDDYRPWAQEKIAELEPDRVLLAGYTQQPLYDPDDGGALEGAERTREDMAAAMRRTLAAYAEISPQVDVIGATNELPDEAADCLGRRDADLGTCATGPAAEVRARNQAWREATKDVGGRFVDPRRWLCADGTCPLVVGNVVVYTDRHHLTRTYARALAPLVGDALDL